MYVEKCNTTLTLYAKDLQNEYVFLYTMDKLAWKHVRVILSHLDYTTRMRGEID